MTFMDGVQVTNVLLTSALIKVFVSAVRKAYTYGDEQRQLKARLDALELADANQTMRMDKAGKLMSDLTTALQSLPDRIERACVSKGVFDEYKEKVDYARNQNDAEHKELRAAVDTQRAFCQTVILSRKPHGAT